MSPSRRPAHSQVGNGAETRPAAESIALSSPLSLLSEGKNASYFRSLKLDLPRLQDVSEKGKLVKFRCMIQDTGISNEVYAGVYGQEADSIDYSDLHERQVVYATSVPGEPRDLADDIQALNLANTSNGVEQSLPMKYPFPDQKHTGALVKLYEPETLRPTEVAEFVGVLDHEPFQDVEVKTLHVVYRIPGQVAEKVAAKAEDRAALIAYIAQSLQGDRLAAEWLLLSLLGRIHARHGALALGQLPINIDVPTALPHLQDTLSNLLPTVKLDFNITSLNASVYSPRSIEENLHSGALQLPAGTAILVDETQMGEGTLKDAGVRNVQALSTVIQEQTLGYVFPFSTFTFETDLKVVVLSKGKSLLPIECIIPLVPSSSSASTVRSTPSSDQFTRFRSLLSFQSKDFSIPPSVSEFIQSDFVRRRQAKTVTQEDLVRRMTVARLMAISHGKTELDEKMWDMTRELDEARIARLP